jgi:hypothetical protein
LFARTFAASSRVAPTGRRTFAAMGFFASARGGAGVLVLGSRWAGTGVRGAVSWVGGSSAVVAGAAACAGLAVVRISTTRTNAMAGQAEMHRATSCGSAASTFAATEALTPVQNASQAVTQGGGRDCHQAVDGGGQQVGDQLRLPVPQGEGTHVAVRGERRDRGDQQRPGHRRPTGRSHSRLLSGGAGHACPVVSIRVFGSAPVRSRLRPVNASETGPK